MDSFDAYRYFFLFFLAMNSLHQALVEPWSSTAAARVNNLDP